MFSFCLLLTSYQYARDDEIDVIVLGASPYMECIRHIRVGLGAANVNKFIPLRSKTNQIPFTI